MITEPFLSFSYECPQCRKAVGAGCLAFSTDTLDCSCGCGGSSLKAKLYDGVLIVRYPCSACGTEHKAEILFADLLRHRFIALLCPKLQTECCTVAFSDMGEYTITPEEIVSYLSDLLGLYPETFLGEAATILREKCNTGCIKCSCGSAQFALNTEKNTIILSCAQCEAKCEFMIFNKDDITSIKNIEEIIL